MCASMHGLKLPVVLLVLLLFLSPTCFARNTRTLTPGLKRDRNAVLALQNSISQSGRSKVGSWKPRGNPCFPKPWPHITCGSGRVVSIDLANLDIVGTLPAQLKNLNKLTSLHLENNQFAGTIPSAWASKTFLRSLNDLNLGNNLLSGALPNRKWNAKGAFRSLEVLALSGNKITGGLPDGWLSTANVFRKLKLLDLSDNKLGYAADGTALTKAQWCPEGRTVDSGWCPSTVNKGRAPTLEIFDVSENGLVGALPTNWPQMFPNLQFLLIQRNGLFATTDVPAALPTDWARRTVPRAFPQLQALVLYPGNDNICSLPDGSGQFLDINTDMSFSVESDDDQEFDSDNPWFCPAPLANNPPTILTYKTDGDNIMISWRQPSGSTNHVYGYRFSLCIVEVDTEECSPVPDFTGKVLRVYGGLDAGLRTFGVSPPTFVELDTGIPTSDFSQYRMDLATMNMDGVESSALTMDLSAVPRPNNVQLTWDSDVLKVNWDAPSPATGVDAYLLTIAKYTGSGSVDVPGYTEKRFASAPDTPYDTGISVTAGEEYTVRVWSYNDATGARSKFFQTSEEI